MLIDACPPSGAAEAAGSVSSSFLLPLAPAACSGDVDEDMAPLLICRTFNSNQQQSTHFDFYFAVACLK